MSVLQSIYYRSRMAAAVPLLALAATASPLLAQQPRVSSGGTDSVALEVLMRGPVHEGFAEPMGGDREFLELPEVAPEPIQELPPAVRPTDEYRDVTWVPGYWGVEGELDELVWVSGTWRYAPPNSRWVPGYWAPVDGRSVWVSGFWIDDTIQRVEYLPTPPPVEDLLPAYDAPGENYFWVPGNYVWTGTQYVWEEGFWAEVQPNWVWTPARYQWTPRGYVYIPGYWDYPVERRGTLFAPVRIASTYQQVYRPTVAINVGRSLVHWFVRPNYRHYYFGNYYGDQYRTIGFTPWAAYVERPTYYDPLYAYYRTSRVDYLQSLVTARQRIVSGGQVQLPIRYSEFQQLAGGPQQSAAAQLTNFVQPVEQLLEGEGEAQFERISEQAGGQIEQYREQIESTRRFARGRLEAEAEAGAEAGVRADARADARAEARGDRQPGDRQPGDRQPADVATDDAGDRPRDAADPADRPDAAEQAENRREAREQARDAADRPDRGQPGEAAARARGSFDMSPFGGQRPPGQTDRGDRPGRGNANADRRSGDAQANPLDAAERGADAARDPAAAAREALNEGRRRAAGTDQPGAAGRGDAPGRADAYRPPPRPEGRGQRGRGAQPGAPGRSGAAERDGNPAAPSAAADRQPRNPNRRPGAAAPGAGDRTAPGAPGASAPGRGNRDPGSPAADRPRPATPAAGNPAAGSPAAGSPPAAAAGGGAETPETPAVPESSEEEDD